MWLRYPPLQSARVWRVSALGFPLGQAVEFLRIYVLRMGTLHAAPGLPARGRSFFVRAEFLRSAPRRAGRAALRTDVDMAYLGDSPGYLIAGAEVVPFLPDIGAYFGGRGRAVLPFKGKRR